MPSPAVVPVPAAATYELRQRVLRPHQTVAEMAMAGDADEATVHLGTYDGPTLTGCLRLQPAACPWTSATGEVRFPGTAWQLRGMAVDPAYRSRGIGAALVAAAVAEVAQRGLIWCNARIPAAAFYRRAGFVPVTPEWDEPDIGPHVGMLRPPGTS